MCDETVTGMCEHGLIHRVRGAELPIHRNSLPLFVTEVNCVSTVAAQTDLARSLKSPKHTAVALAQLCKRCVRMVCVCPAQRWALSFSLTAPL